MKRTFTLNIPISKIDEEQRIVTGVATSEALDSQGDIIDYEASKIAFKDWIGNIREMHEPKAIGKAIDVQFDDKKKEVILSAKISESADGENAWTKIKEGILTGYSIGGQIFKITKDKAVEGANRIVDYALSETSLVDNPANPDAQLIMVKSFDGKLQRVEAEIEKGEQHPEVWWIEKFMKGKNMKKSVYDAQEALSLASQLTWLILIEEPDQREDLVTAFNALRNFAEKEVAEGDDFEWETEYDEAIELANKAINLRKGKKMADKKVEKTNVVGGEERNLDAKVTETQEQAGRPVNDTEERATEAGVPAVGEVVTDKKGEPVKDEDGNEVVQDREYAEDDKTKAQDDSARNDSTPPQDKEVVGEEEAEEAEEEKGDEDGDKSEKVEEDGDSTKETESKSQKKSDEPSDILKNVHSLLTKLDKANGGELKKVAEAVTELGDKVEKSMTDLEDRISKLEKQPMPTKAKASYQVISKGDEEEVDDGVAELQKRQDELIANPELAKPGEMYELAMKLRKANIGKRIELK